jgi:hypothetical protein
VELPTQNQVEPAFAMHRLLVDQILVVLESCVFCALKVRGGVRRQSVRTKVDLGFRTIEPNVAFFSETPNELLCSNIWHLDLRPGVAIRKLALRYVGCIAQSSEWSGTLLDSPYHG